MVQNTYIYTGQTLKPLEEGDNVRIRDTRKNNWMRKAKVVEQHKSPRSYLLKLKMEITFDVIAVIYY